MKAKTTMRIVTVIQEGQTHEIPEMWIIGRMRALNDNTPKGYRTAVDMWIEQEAMSARLIEEDWEDAQDEREACECRVEQERGSR